MFRRSTKKLQRSSSKVAPTSPTLPDVHTGAPVSWPQDFEVVHPPPVPVNVARVPDDNTAPSPTASVAVPSFHRPFRRDSAGGHSNGNTPAGGPISAIYTARGSAFDKPIIHPSPPAAIPPSTSLPANANLPTRTATRSVQRRVRRPKQATPTFNLMVCGAIGCGKTSFLRLLLASSDISPGASVDQRAALASFLSTPLTPTPTLATAVVELQESPTDRILLSVVDTPGFDYRDGRQLALERQVSGVVKFVSDLYHETMGEEAKVIRDNKGDQHIHLCIYLIDPTSLIPVSARQPLTPDTPDTPAAKFPDSLGDPEAVELPPAELKVLKRLGARLNVLPVIAKADTLTNEALAAAKAAIKRGVAQIGLDSSVFASPDEGSPDSSDEEPGSPQTTRSAARGRRNRGVRRPVTPDDSEDVSDTGSTASKKVVKLRHSHSFGSGLRRARSLSRLRGDPDGGAGTDYEDGSGPDAASVAVVRFGARPGDGDDGAIAVRQLPFAVVAPQSSVGGKGSRPLTELTDPAPVGSRVRTLRGVFVRRFRWGALDALDPRHSDFPALRRCVLGTHAGRLRTATREVLYEAYRTEKLLARRMTQGLSRDQANALLEELGLMKSPTSDIDKRVSSIMDG